MNVAVREPKAAQRLLVVDCDIHPTWRTPTELYPFLPQRWRDHMTAYGTFFRHGLTGQLPFPRMMAGGMRADSFPADGSPPGADLDLMRRQHLDANGVEVGMLIALSRGGMEERNLDFAAALSKGMSPLEAVRFGSAVAGISVTRAGTAPSMPDLAEVEALLA